MEDENILGAREKEVLKRVEARRGKKWDKPSKEWVKFEMPFKNSLFSSEDNGEKKECKDCDYFVIIENVRLKGYACAYYAIVDVENIPPMIKNAPKGCPLNAEEFLEDFHFV